MKKIYFKPTSKTVILKSRATLLTGSQMYLKNSNAADSDSDGYYDDL